MFISGHFRKALLILGMPVLASAAFKYWDPTDTAAVPKFLSQMGMYQDSTIKSLPASKKKLDTNIFHFEVNSALWSDAAHKTRWVLLKNRNLANGAGSIKYDEKNDYWGYPDSAILIKQFAIDTNGLDTNSRVLWETRFLVNKKEAIDEKGTLSDRWYGFSYKWRKNQQDADLVNITRGMDDSIRVWPNGTGAGKTSMMKKWHFPSTYQCEQCHRVNSAEKDSAHGRAVLGFFTAQLNRAHPDQPTLNQLEYFFTKKVLTGTKSNWNAATTPHWRSIDDNTASADVRARSYIAANCSGCHGRRGIETGAAMGIDLNYDFHTMEAKMDFRNRVLSWPFGLDTLPPYFYPKNDSANVDHVDSLPIEPALVVPGYPEKSIILFRQKSRNTEPGNYDVIRNQMPPLGSFEPNTQAITVMTQWIKEMPVLPIHASVAIRHGAYRSALKGPVIRNGLVIIPGDLASPFKVAVKITGIDGRTLDLRAISRTTFALPAGLPKGVYILRVGEQSFARYLF